MSEGRNTFRYDTQRDFFGNTIGRHQAIEGAAFGGVGGCISPKTALAVGLKVDSDALPADVVAAIKAGQVNMDDPAVTLSLLKLGAVVGVIGIFNNPDQPTQGLKAIGIQCAMCHSTVDDSFAPGIGKRTFFDPRLDNAERFPIAARNGFGHLSSPPGEDRISPKLPALQFYQLALPAPTPPPGSFDAVAAARGRFVFNGQGQCAACHVPPTFTEPGWNMHTAQEMSIDDFQASRSPDDRYRTTPLAGRLFDRTRGFYHDGRFATLLDVVNHYDSLRKLGLSEQLKQDLVEYLKSL
jgi:cytochrome c5